MSEIKAETQLAKIVHQVDPGYARGSLEVVINQGSRHGVKTGDRFFVFGTGPHIADPDTSEDLGVLELVRGRGEVVHIQEQMATVRSVERRGIRPAKRIIREPATGVSSLARALLGDVRSSTGVIEEELAPEAEMPFESVQLGDLAKPI